MAESGTAASGSPSSHSPYLGSSDMEKVQTKDHDLGAAPDSAPQDLERAPTGKMSVANENDGTSAKSGYSLGQAATGVSRASAVSKSRGIVFVVFIVLTQLVQMIPYGAGIDGAFVIGRALGAGEAEFAWIAASYPLTQGSFVLISGRLGTVFGHKNVLQLGALIWIFWTLATAYGNNIVGVSFMRGLAGIGGGLMVSEPCET